jgi:hypothetical protein
MKASASLNYKLWDLNSYTAADYSVKIRIPEVFWKTWIEKVHNVEKENSKSNDQYFQAWFEKTMLQ